MELWNVSSPDYNICMTLLFDAIIHIMDTRMGSKTYIGTTFVPTHCVNIQEHLKLPLVFRNISIDVG